MDYDIKITGGTIYDGTGAEGSIGDIGIKDGKVVALGKAEGTAAREVDATGRIVCPGFVDIHTHYDAQIVWDRFLDVSPWHGVTTAVIGNCGFGVAPTKPEDRLDMLRTLEKVEGMGLAAMQAGIGEDWGFESFGEYLDVVEAKGIGINIAVLAGHTPIRFHVMGRDSMKREATQDEIDQMAALVKGAIKAGAVGFGTSNIPLHNAFDGLPVPSRMATTDEIDQLVGAMAEEDGGKGVLMVAAGPVFHINEMTAISKKHNRNVTWAALLADGNGKEGSHRRMIDMTLQAHNDGAKVFPQVSCRPLQFDFNMGEPYPLGMAQGIGDILAAEDDAAKKEIYNSDAFRKTMRDESDAETGFYVRWYERTVISLNPLNADDTNRPITQLAAEAGKHPVDYVLDLSVETDFKARFRFDLMNYDEDEVAFLLDHADGAAVIGLSDAGAHADQLCDASFSSHLLGHWVRDKKVLPMNRAINILTKHAADIYGIKDRGRLEEGLPADVVIFDPETIGALPLERVFDMPANGERLISGSKGMEMVIVNGTVLRENDAYQVDPDGTLPGRLLRNGVSV